MGRWSCSNLPDGTSTQLASGRALLVTWSDHSANFKERALPFWHG